MFQAVKDLGINFRCRRFDLLFFAVWAQSVAAMMAVIAAMTAVVAIQVVAV